MRKGTSKAVPVGGASGLTVAPDQLSRRYTRYLQEGAGDDFATGPHTSVQRKQRLKEMKRTSVRNRVRGPGGPVAAVRPVRAAHRGRRRAGLLRLPAPPQADAAARLPAADQETRW
ncbi:hypothetical protein TPA0909_00080 [Streptomyces albus]|nr:hypothetical protein TPA0909_00080 [Streptomyces albus]